VSLDPSLHDDHEHFRLQITFHAFGHRQVEWKSLPVIVRQEEMDRETWIAFVNDHGRCVFPELPVGTYTLLASAQYGGSSGPVLNGTGPSEPIECRSVDKLVTATFRQLESGDSFLSFETQEKSLAQSKIVFALVRDSGWVWHSDEVYMSQSKDRAGSWIADWSDSIAADAPCRLVFGVFNKKTVTH
jgi:hypothetical protein